MKINEMERAENLVFEMGDNQKAGLLEAMESGDIEAVAARIYPSYTGVKNEIVSL